MRLEELVGMKYLDTPHEEFYSAVVNALGYEEVKSIIPFSIEDIDGAFDRCDKHLNTLKLDKWVKAGGFERYMRGVIEDFRPDYNSPMMKLYHKHEVFTYSPSEGVSILKQCAKMYHEEWKKTR